MSTVNVSAAKALLNTVIGKTLSSDERAGKAVELAVIMMIEADRIQTSEEKKIAAKLGRMVEDPKGKQFTAAMTDECFRSKRPGRVADQINFLLEKHGVPQFLDLPARLQMQVFKVIGKPFANQLIPVVKSLIRKETAKVILDGNPAALEKHISKRKLEGVTTNLNHLGEAILGEEEALHRLETYLADLNKPSVEYISIKITTIFSQLNLLAWDKSIDTLAERLRKLYRAAMENQFIHPVTGAKSNKFVNLDMEEYRDLRLTTDLFKKVLSEPEFLTFKGGIVLQAYLPDAYSFLVELIEWSKQRMAKGGAPIKVRVVKGANMAMEQFEASARGWELAPYSRKIDTDANYRKMLLHGTKKDNATAVNLGIASHNLFDLAHALILVEERGISNCVQFEMLEGMAEHIRTVVQGLASGMVLYCPAAEAHEFQSAIAYLIRRLDENTAAENFLRHSFDLHAGNETFKKQTAFFLDGLKLAESIDNEPRRTQDRTKEPIHPDPKGPFQNEADTDFSLPANRTWARKIYEGAISARDVIVPLVIKGQEIQTGMTRAGHNPSRNQSFYQVQLAEADEIEAALAAAQEGFGEWSKTSVEQRCELLLACGRILRERRGDLVKTMMLDTGKILIEADVEVSEAIDFCEYYARSLRDWSSVPGLELEGRGVVLVTPPWNFPCAIPLGGVLAALAAGNSVIFKPAPESCLTGWETFKCLRDAGLPAGAVQFINCEDDPHGSSLIKDPRVTAVILTGATETAQLFLKMRPDLDLAAETGGKNSIIVTDLADRDLAIADIVASAFGHGGQKCSACSLVILEAAVYDDPKFRQALKDAASSLKVGSALDPATKVNPLVNPPRGKLLQALTKLEEGESWLLEPKQDPGNPHLWSPGIKLGVKAGGFTFTTEFFGPVLGLVRADSLEHAIELQCSSPFGLTGGIHTLDRREQEFWVSKAQVGNAYLNRSITGAIVQRQPFGGYKNSAFGRGLQAGGPNYLVQFMKVKETALPKASGTIPAEATALKSILVALDAAATASFEASLASYVEAAAAAKAFKDPSKVTGQHNYSRYAPYSKVFLMVRPEDKALDIYRSIACALICGTLLEVVATAADITRLKLSEIRHNSVVIRSVSGDDEAKKLLCDSSKARFRLISKVDVSWQTAAASSFCWMQALPVYSLGRLEILHYLRAMSVSDNFHRYGNTSNAKF